MLKSVLLFGGSYNKNRLLSIVFIISLILNVLIVQIGKLYTSFVIINSLVFLVIPILISRIKNKHVNAILSLFSVLIWSIIIDIYCFYAMPQFVGGASLFEYVYRGILFNARYVLYNLGALIVIELLGYGMNLVAMRVKARYGEKTKLVKVITYLMATN